MTVRIPPVHIPAPGASPGFRVAWFKITVVAEFFGFAIPAATGLAGWRLGLPSPAFYASMVIAGLAEGAALGFGQSRVLRRMFPGISGAWTTRTAAAAAVAWAIGMLPSTLNDMGAPTWAIVALVVPLAPLLLLSIGFAQWTVLRGNVPDAWKWIPATAFAWLAALPPSFIAPSIVPDSSPVAVWTVAFLCGGLAMAAIMAAITGQAMWRLLTTGGTEVEPALASA